MTTARRHAWRPRRQTDKGFILIALLVMLTMGGLYFLVSNLTPEAMETRRQAKTEAALVQAREALIGYSLQYREQQIATNTLDAMYGFLPMPDVGTSRFHASQTPACNTEGCAMSFVNGTFPSTTATVVGRFPWRTLGTGPLLDGHSECLWYIVSANFKSLGMDANAVMNWDTLGQIDVVTTNDTADLQSLITNAHNRPLAIIFSPGPLLGSQVRGQIGSDVVTECGGNYNPANYLEPSLAAAILDNDMDSTSTYFTGAIPTDTSPTSLLAISTQGKIVSDGTNLKKACPSGTNCSLVANDIGLPITSELLFRTLRGSSYFRTDINSMLDRMVGCLRDQVAAGTGFTPLALGGFTAPVGFDKTVGRIPTSTCYGDTQNPLGYFSHYGDLVFVAKPDTGSWAVTVDGVSQTSCSAALFFGSQRGASQPRTNTTERGTPTSYLEGANLTGFTTTGTPSFAGPSLFGVVKANRTNQHDIDRCLVAGNWTVSADCHSVEQDIVRCIPAGASLTVTAPTVAATAGNIQLASYVPATSTLTLGSAGINSNYGASAAALYACAWTPEIQAAGGGFRSYFRFRIRRVGEGFTFAVIDGDRNANDPVGNGIDDDGNGIIDDGDVCGAAGQHLGYSGNNAGTRYIQAPKLAIEFDTARNCKSSTFDASGRPACVFTEAGNTLSNGRNDPCYTTSCWSGSPIYPGTSQGLDNSSHIGIVYWGYGSALTLALQDDNVHDQVGWPMPTDPSPRPGPRNPAPVLPYVANPVTIPGIAPLDRMGGTDAAKREFHARVEVTRSFTAPADAKNGATSVQVQLWIEPHTAASISAMTYNAGTPPTLTVAAASHGLNTGDTVVIKDAAPTGYNGEYVVTKIDANNFTATLPSGTVNPGQYISAIGWVNIGGSPDLPDRATVTSANHGLSDGSVVTISGAIPPEYNGTRTITRIDANSYYFDLELSYEPGDLFPAIAAAKALTPRAIKLANTTRPMSELDAADKPFLTDNATIYDEQMAACAVSAPRCPGGQSCGSDNMCYRPSFRNLRLGFTTAERPTTTTNTARGQLIEIKDRATTWLP
jgi:hypothetical protein